MDAERLTPPSPTATEVAGVKRLAQVFATSYSSERAQGIADALAWILGEADRPRFLEGQAKRAAREN